jgi:hypothetical protein
MKMLLKNISLVITMAIFTDNCMFRFSILVSVDSQNCNLVWYTSTHRVAFSTPVFCSCFFIFGETHMAPNSLTLQEPMSIVSWVKSLYLAHVWGLSSLSCGLRSKYPSCLLY